MQWLAVATVLAKLGFSAIAAPDWAKQKIENAMVSSDNDVFELDFSTRFPWPKWSQEAMEWGTALAALISRESVECMVGNSQSHLLPVIYWLLYPLFATFWQAILCVLLVKCV